MAARMHHVHGASGSRAVEVSGGGMPSLCELALVIAVGPERSSGLELGSAPAEELDERINGRGVLWTHLGPRRGLAVHQWVDVRVDEPGNQDQAAEVPLLAALAGDGPAVRERAGIQDAIAAERHSFDTLRIGHGQDRSTGEDEWIRVTRSGRVRRP